MKIIEYTLGIAPFRRGGLPRYSTDLSDELAKDNDVYVLYPGKINFLINNKIKVLERKTKHNFTLMEMINPLPVSLGLGIKTADEFMQPRDVTNLMKFIDKINPDVIHFHTFMGFPLEALKEIQKRKIRTVFTTHDFYGFCPKMLEENPYDSLKYRKCSYDCMLCKDGPSYKKMLVMQSRLYEGLKNTAIMKKIRKDQKSQLNVDEDSDNQPIASEEVNSRYLLRKYYKEMYSLIDKFHFNSTVSRDYVRRFLPNVDGKVVNITHSGLIDERSSRKYVATSNSTIKLAYVGPYDAKKGFFELVNCLEKVREAHKNFEVYFYGDIAEHPFFDNDWVYNMGIQPEGSMSSIYKNIDLLILPSLWHETFGFVTLEASLAGTPVIVSKNVGAKDILDKDNVFKDANELVTKLNRLLSDNYLDSVRSRVMEISLKYKMHEHSQDIVAKFY